MKRLAHSVIVVQCLALQWWFAGIATAQEPVEPLTVKRPHTVSMISAGEVAATPDMWFYEQQLRRYEDPRNSVRAQAEMRTAQRQNRIAAMKWFGFSNSRPTANFDPVHGSYSPRWVSNGYMPAQWQSSGSTVVVESDSARRY